MNKFLALLFLMSTLTAAPIYREAAIDHANRTYINETIEVIKAKGFIKLEGTNVSRFLYVFGRLKANDATIEKMESIGPTVLIHSVVKKRSSISGPLIATTTTFLEELSVTSEKATFNGSTLTSLYVHKLKQSENIQVIELKENTVINGPIIFESGQGEVILHGGSKVLGGIIGGQIKSLQ